MTSDSAAIFSLLQSLAAVNLGEFLPLALLFWVLHFTLAMVLASPFLLYAVEHPRWNSIDILGLLLPFSLWAACMAVDARSPMTAFYLSAAIALLAAVRVAIGTVRYERVLCGILLVLLCAAGLCMYIYGHYWPTLFLWEY